MGDMGDYFRDWDESKKIAKAERLSSHNSRNDVPWTKHTEHHWSIKLSGVTLDFWPSTGKFRHNNRTMHGDVYGYIRRRI